MGYMTHHDGDKSVVAIASFTPLMALMYKKFFFWGGTVSGEKGHLTDRPTKWAIVQQKNV